MTATAETLTLRAVGVVEKETKVNKVDVGAIDSEALVTILREASQELTNRSLRDQVVAVLDSAQGRESPQQKQEREVREREAKEQREWGELKSLGQAVQTVLGRGHTLTVWSRDGEVRVYIDQGDTKKAVYYATGNGSKPPKTLELSDCPPGSRQHVKWIVRAAAKDWLSLRGVNCDEAAAADVPEAWPIPESITHYAFVRPIRVAEQRIARGMAALDKEQAHLAALEKQRLEPPRRSYPPYRAYYSTDGKTGFDTIEEAIKHTTQAIERLRASIATAEADLQTALAAYESRLGKPYEADQPAS